MVICDGFVGNIILKLGESVATALPEMLRAEIARQDLSDAERAAVGRVFHGVGQRFNYEVYGGAFLLGVRGNVIIGHGGSSARAVERMIEVAVEAVQEDITASIAQALGGPSRS